MTSADLKPQQAAALAEQLARQAQYLSRLVYRMQQLRWPHDDPVYARTVRARDAVLALLETVDRAKELDAVPAWVRARDV